VGAHVDLTTVDVLRERLVEDEPVDAVGIKVILGGDVRTSREPGTMERAPGERARSAFPLLTYR